jgi:lauroyl/myristoyl acyltransferase
MKSYTIINSRFNLGMVIFLARQLPPAAGYRFADLAATWMSRQKQMEMVRAVRTNQWIVRGMRSDSAELDQHTLDVFTSTARSYYDLYHSIRRPGIIIKKVSFTPASKALINECGDSNKAHLLLALHLGNFDLAGRALGLNGLPFQILSYPMPPSSYKWQNRMRIEAGLEVTPFSGDALRQATLRLESGGTVLTGIDRPVESVKYRPEFFGHASGVPVTHIRLAIKTNAIVQVVACINQGYGRYLIDVSESIPLEQNKNLENELVYNAERILHHAEHFISQHPQQWAMFFPVWPDLIKKTPK